MTEMAMTPEMQAGQYSNSLVYKLLLRAIEAQFPGAGAIIEQLAELLPWNKLVGAITEALKDWREGKDFLTILIEAVKDWIDVTPTPDGPIRFSAKATD